MMRRQSAEQNQNAQGFDQLHFGPKLKETPDRLRSETVRRIKSRAFLPANRMPAARKIPPVTLRNPRGAAQNHSRSACEGRLVLFRDNRPQKLMHKIHTLTDN